MICSTASSSSSSSHHTPHGRSVSLSSYPSSRRYDEGRSGGGGFSDHRRKERGDAENRDMFGEDGGGGGGGGGGGIQAAPLSFSSGQSVIANPPASSHGGNSSSGAVRVASTVVTNVMRPVISTPLPITSKPRDGGTSSSPHPTDRKSHTPQQQPQLLISSGAGVAAAPPGGGCYSSSSPSPLSGGLGPGGVVTNLVLGGALSAHPAVQLINPSPQPQPPHQQTLSSAAAPAPHSQTNGPLPLPLLQSQFLPASSLAAPGGKAITQVQYILPTLSANSNPKSPPQQLSQPTGIFNLPTAPPTHMSLANGKQQGTGSLPGYTSSPAVGVVSPGTRGEPRAADTPPPMLVSHQTLTFCLLTPPSANTVSGAPGENARSHGNSTDCTSPCSAVPHRGPAPPRPERRSGWEQGQWGQTRAGDFSPTPLSPPPSDPTSFSLSVLPDYSDSADARGPVPAAPGRGGAPRQPLPRVRGRSCRGGHGLRPLPGRTAASGPHQVGGQHYTVI